MIANDLRFAVRVLARRPAYAAVSALVLSLGIGANTAVFSVVDGVLLRPLPYPAPDRIAMLWQDNSRKGVREGLVSYANFADWRDRTRAFERIAAFNPSSVELVDGGERDELPCAFVSAGFFEVMGVAPALGRGFTAEEEEPGRNLVVVFGHDAWQRRFGGDPAVLGRAVEIGDKSYTVVGVMPPGFAFPEKAEAWLPRAVSPQMRTKYRQNVFLRVVGRLAPGVAWEQARADMDTVAARLAEAYPAEDEGIGVNVVPLEEQTIGAARRPILLLWAAVAVVLLVGCTNLAGLALARAAGRRREIAVRLAIGAGRAAVIRQLVTESALVGLAGGALGFALAAWGVRAFVAFAPPGVPRLDAIGVDARVLAFTALVSLATGVALGLVPALQVSKPDLVEALKEGGAQASDGRRSRRHFRALVVAETALTVVLLATAGLTIRSLWRLQSIDLGFDPHHLLLVGVKLSPAKYPYGPQLDAFEREIEARAAAVPGVAAAGATSRVFLDPTASQGMTVPILVDGRPADAQPKEEVPVAEVSPAYFGAIGVPVLSGRGLDASDLSGDPVAIINETMARRLWPDEDAVGRRFKFNEPDFESPWFTVVGVARDVKHRGPEGATGPEIYLPSVPNPLVLVARTTGDPAAAASSVREAIRGQDPAGAVVTARTMDDVLSAKLAGRRFTALLLASFAGAALVLAAVGIYGVVSYTTSLRTQEIGVRMALGARAGDVLRLVVGQTAVEAAVGIAIGVGASLALSRVVESLLFDVSATDPATLAAVAAIVASVGLASSYLPARRASRLDPAETLRAE